MLDSPLTGLALFVGLSIVFALRWEAREPRAVMAAFRSAIATALLFQLIAQALTLVRRGWIDGLLLTVGLVVSVAYSWVICIGVISLRRWLRHNMPP